MKKKHILSLLSATVILTSSITNIFCMNSTATSITIDSSSKQVAELISFSYDRTTTGFVERMYNVVLNRNPDATGLKNWVNKLNNHTATAADIVDGFFFSDEYKGKHKTSDEMIIDCYNAMLDRAPDSTGRANWKKYLDVGMTIQAVCNGFVESNEFNGLCEKYGIIPGRIKLRQAKDFNYERTYFVYRLYKNCLGRTPDGTGLENWCKAIENGHTGSELVQGFIFSDEYKNKNSSNSDYIRMLYATMLGRTPDNSGLNNWSSQLNNGTSREKVTNGFIFSDEFKRQCSRAGITIGSKIPTPEEVEEAQKVQKNQESQKSPSKREDQGKHVYITKTGKKYHYCNPCGSGTYYEVTLERALAAGLEPCEKCVLH